jgi:hypothetical protein
MLPVKIKFLVSMTKKNFKKSNCRTELILPTEFSLGLKFLIHGREGLYFNSSGLEHLPLDSWEFKFFCGGVEKHQTQLQMTEEIFENLISCSKFITSEKHISFKYKILEPFSIGLKSIYLLNSSDWWYILWKGWNYLYNDPEKYDENYKISNKIHFMTKTKRSKYDINSITMDDINNYSLPV